MTDLYFTLRDICFTRSGRPPLFQNLNFEVRKGQAIAITGDNGAGKTSLFHLMMGLHKPQSGEVHAFGELRLEEKDFLDVRTQTGLLFQNSDDQLFCPTVEEDVSFGPLNLGASHKQALEITHKTLSSLGLAGYEKRITHHLSGGEKRMVALASVLAMKPKVLLLDELTSGLDRQAYQRLKEVLLELSVAKVIISHDAQFLSDLTHQHYHLEDGQLHFREN